MKYRLVFILFSFIAVIYSKNMYDQNKLLERKGKIDTYKVIEKTCMKKSGSSIVVLYLEKEYIIQYKRSECEALSIGDMVSLIYDLERDLFFVPGSLRLYKRYIYGALFLLLMSLFPWKWIKNKIVYYDNFFVRKLEEK